MKNMPESIKIKKVIYLMLVAGMIGIMAYLMTKPQKIFQQLIQNPFSIFASQFTSKERNAHFIDQSAIFSESDIDKFNQYLSLIMQESDIDLRFIFTKNIEPNSIEEVAVKMMDDLNIGGKTGQQRGVLFLYDMAGQKIKIEVGYGLEAWFPDAFIDEVLEKHTRYFFANGQPTQGLRTMVYLMHQRIREAVIGNDFDPSAIDGIHQLAHLSGGGGVSSTLGLHDGERAFPSARQAPESVAMANNSPEQAYQNYLRWLAMWPASPRTALFTEDSQRYLAAQHFSPLYANMILLNEYRKEYTIIERDDLAILIFTNTPFCSPHFFIKKDGVWAMDLAAEVRNTHETSGGEYSWVFVDSHDAYGQSFQDLLQDIRGYLRLQGGDNRALPIHG